MNLRSSGYEVRRISSDTEALFCAKVYETPYGLIVAICDIELVGKKLYHGKNEILVSKDFYCDREIDTFETMSLMRKATSLNLIGNRIVELAISMGLVHEDAILYLRDEKSEKVAHALVHLFRF